MSDTDKDRPDWVTARWWEPSHWNCEYDVPTGQEPFRWQCRSWERVCDLPDRPVRRRPERITWRARHRQACVWWPVYERRKFRYKSWNPPGWFIHDRWTGVERRQIRDDARRAIAEHRATGEVDVIMSTRQHRHCAGWLWD